MTKKLKKRLKRILSGAALFVLAIVIENLMPMPGNWVLIFFLLAYSVVGGDVVKKAIMSVMLNLQIVLEIFLEMQISDCLGVQ